MEVLGMYQLFNIHFEVVRSGNGFRFIYLEVDIVSVEMPYHEVVSALTNRPYERI